MTLISRVSGGSTRTVDIKGKVSAFLPYAQAIRECTELRYLLQELPQTEPLDIVLRTGEMTGYVCWEGLIWEHFIDQAVIAGYPTDSALDLHRIQYCRTSPC